MTATDPAPTAVVVPSGLVVLDAAGRPVERSPLADIVSMFRVAARSVSRAFESLACAARAAGEAHHAPPIEDPMARALRLRQHRNTGPTVHADPRRNR